MTIKNSRFRFFLRKTCISCFCACNYFVSTANFTELLHINLCSLHNVAFSFSAQRATVIFMQTAFFCFVFLFFALLRIIFISVQKSRLYCKICVQDIFLRRFLCAKNAASVQICTQCGIYCADVFLTRLAYAVPEKRGIHGTSTAGKGFGIAHRPPCRWRPAHPQTHTRR